MNIRISRLAMTNFKCFREKEIRFQGNTTIIQADNGKGKTTIADAIYFCLFGKNSDSQSDLELFKTRANGETVHHLDCSVELDLEGVAQLGEATGFANVTLKRCIKEVWIKKHGAEETVFKNNTVEYYINGETCSKGEYEKYIASIINEQVFRAISDPTYFTSLPWKDQRNFLIKMAGDDASPEKVCGDNEKLKQFVTDILVAKRENPDDALRHTRSKIKDIKDKLQRIPIRLEEQNKALPDNLDWVALAAEQNDIQKQLELIDNQILQLQQGNGADIKRAEIRQQINDIQKQVDEIEWDCKSAEQKERGELREKISEASIKFNVALNDQKLMETTISADKKCIERCKETIAECTKTREELLAQWPKDKFVFDESLQFCPTCGQYLPPEQIASKKEELRKAFNLDIERRKQAINEKGQKNNEAKETAEKELKDYEQKLVDDEKSLAEIKDRINTIFKEKAQLEKSPVTTYEQLIEKNPEHATLTAKLADLKAQLNSVTDSEDDKAKLDELRTTKQQLNVNLSDIVNKLATRSQRERIEGLIKGIEDEEKALIKQLSELEQQEDTASLYISRQNRILESLINKHFKLVQWRLFKVVNNGGDSFEDPFCECYVKGQPYHKGLNQADRVNAGLDICETLSQHYSLAAPIVIDNAESNLHIFPTTGQQIRLQVAPTELTVL